jgi:hypothetical protein
MTISSESSGDPGASAVTYSETRDADNRWGPAVVAAIIAAIALVAAGITAAVVLSNKPTVPEPPHPLMPNVGKPIAAATLQVVAPTQAGEYRVDLVSTQTPLASGTVMAAGNSVDLGNGIGFDVPDGWKLVADEKGFKQVINNSYAASFAVFDGTVTAKDSSKPINAGNVLVANVQIMEKNYGFQVDKASDPEVYELKPEAQVHFDQMAGSTWSGSIATQQGTSQKVGEFGTLFNTGQNTKINSGAGYFVFIVMESSDKEKYASAAPDMSKMYTQLIGSPSASS